MKREFELKIIEAPEDGLWSARFSRLFFAENEPPHWAECRADEAINLVTELINVFMDRVNEPFYG